MFSDVVRLYRLVGRPEIDGGSFSYHGASSVELVAAIEACTEIRPEEGLGRFDDGPDFESGIVSFEWRLAANDGGRFYSDIVDFVENATSLSRGVVPRNYYIVSEDSLSLEERPSEAEARVLRLAKLVQFLQLLSYGDASESSFSASELIFILDPVGGEGPQTVKLKTKITPRCVSEAGVDTSSLELLLASEMSGSLHRFEYQQIFRSAIGEVLRNWRSEALGSEFEYLVAKWAKVREIFDYNCDVYVRRFSFERLKKDVAKIELDFAARAAAVLSDGAARMLALPLSVAAIAAIWSEPEVLARVIYLVGAIVVTFIVSASLWNQALAADRISRSLDFVFEDAGQGGGSSAPAAIDSHITAAKYHVSKQLRFGRAVRRALWVIAFAAPAVGFIIVIFDLGKTG